VKEGRKKGMKDAVKEMDGGRAPGRCFLRFLRGTKPGVGAAEILPPPLARIACVALDFGKAAANFGWVVVVEKDSLCAGFLASGP
jgi:hypothetical protein